MAVPEEDYSNCSALVVDPNPTSRSILVSQLRDFGMGNVAQASRTLEVRQLLEYRVFDFVLCEQYFNDESASGQELLDDLRRNQLLPFSTVFIMITGEATYSKVAEAAESALDGYLLKPHKASQLEDRLHAARVRKISMHDIFAAIEAEDFERAANLCLERFESRSIFWLYAARVGAELLLRLERTDEAQQLYQAVIAAKTLPWARLGVARAQLESGQAAQAASLLETLINEDPNYADAYDVMGRAQFELGKFDMALDTYRMAAKLTPSSISRIQKLAMMTFFGGDHVEAEKLLDRTARMGLDSKMFDCQTLVLLAFARLESGDRKGLFRCQEDFNRLLERNPDNPRYRRQADIVIALNLIQQQQFGPAVDAVRQLTGRVRDPDFDFEAACNLLALMAQLAYRSIRLEDIEFVVDTLGLRFCSNRPLTELMVNSAAAHPPYAERIRVQQTVILERAETAIALSMSGDPGAAVRNLLRYGQACFNARLIDNAYQLLQKHIAKIPDAQDLGNALQHLRSLYGTGIGKAVLGEQKRQSGGLVLRTGNRAAAEKAAASPAVK
ncbi:response regulator [Rhodoferax saidenbachensis]|uniref:Response regulator n=1 Tax=Rhodoferax saidenbachensis TaxID=1484693 RepID=A0A1P8K7D5_9BURK|nr:tetratricopeptide repeat protein [Rhodoferax saidenbachensis]APW41904.1 response regulator [Rhodoferax saidenbachensis]